jgi:class 3 adenylate cyclase
MDALTLTAVFKSDLAGWTDLTGRLAPEGLQALIRDHDRIARGAVETHGGRIVKGEGDAYWAAFPSVTGAVRAAFAFKAALREREGAESFAALRARFVVTVGDVVHEGGDLFGPAVNLAARIEGLTPADSVYLSDAAWACLGRRGWKAEVAETFVPKGFQQPVTVYQVEPDEAVGRHTDRVMLYTDLQHYTRFVNAHIDHVQRLDRVVSAWTRCHERAAEAAGGRIRVSLGDSFLVELPSVVAGARFFERLCADWWAAAADLGLPRDMSLRASLNVGDYLLIGNSAVGPGITDAARALHLADLDPGGEDATLIVSEVAAAGLADSVWQASIRPVVVDLPGRAHTLGPRAWRLRIPRPATAMAAAVAE